MTPFESLTPIHLAAALLAAAGILVELIRRALTARAQTAQFRSPLALVSGGLLFGAFALLARLAGEAVAPAVPYLDAVAWGLSSIGVVRIALTLFVEFYIRRQSGAALSAIVRDVTSLIAYFIVIVVVLRSTLDINLASLITTSAILTAIIGLALQDILGNVLSGLVLEIEQAFSRGDWVRVGGFEGVVVETGWRTTKIRTRVNELITLPNSLLSKEAIVNYSRPDPRFGDTIRFEAAYEISPSHVQDTVTAIFQADPSVLAEPALEVRTEKFAESGVGYAVRYWITEFNDLERIRSRLHSKLWYALRRADIRIPFPARDLFVYPGSGISEPRVPDNFATLRAIPLLSVLSDTSLIDLCSRVQRRTYGRGELVVREGDPGDSFYVIEKGAADVILGDPATGRSVADLSTGSFFGETSLLVGEPRNATVRATSDLTVLVIDREAFKQTIEADPAIIGALCDVVGRRQAELAAKRAETSNTESDTSGQHVYRLGERIRAFFGLQGT